MPVLIRRHNYGSIELHADPSYRSGKPKVGDGVVRVLKRDGDAQMVKWLGFRLFDNRML